MIIVIAFFCSTPPIVFDGNFKQHWVCALIELTSEVWNSETPLYFTNKSYSGFPVSVTNNCPACPVSFLASFCNRTVFCVLRWKRVKWKNIFFRLFPCFISQNTEQSSVPFFLGRGWGAGVLWGPVYYDVAPTHCARICVACSRRVWTVSYSWSRRYVVMLWPRCQ
jgi:hypothetical protein